jgi:hypothetical protein
MANFLVRLKFTITPILSALREILWALLVTASKQAPPSWQQMSFARLKGTLASWKWESRTRKLGQVRCFTILPLSRVLSRVAGPGVFL